jgi:MoxR-like ATPase
MRSPHPPPIQPPHFLDALPEDQRFNLRDAHQAVVRLRDHIENLSRDPNASGPRIVGQSALIHRLLSSLIIGEHCLLEGLPGLVKTKASNAVADAVGLAFRRIQFTPDMLPSDLISRERLMPKENGGGTIMFERGPVFTNILLADEINRASSKVQAALLEATEERAVTTLYHGRLPIRPAIQQDQRDVDEGALIHAFGSFYGSTLPPERLQHFMVLATMNPIEQEGVFPLSEAQKDRFAFYVIVEIPHGKHFKEISEHAFEHQRPRATYDGRAHVKSLYFLSELREQLLGMGAKERWFNPRNDDLREDCEALVNFSHLNPTRDDDAETLGMTPLSASVARKQDELNTMLKRWRSGGDVTLQTRSRDMTRWQQRPDAHGVESGASPRGLLKLIRAAHVEAFLRGAFDRDGFVASTWDHVCAVAPDVLRHRIRLRGGAMAMGATTDQFIQELLTWITRRASV